MTQKKEKTPELSYEQLKAYVLQMEAQAKKVYQENMTLKQIINSKDIDYAFKCLEHKELFSKPFINNLVERLEEILDPDNTEKVEQESKEEEK